MFGIFGVDVSTKFIFTICLEMRVLIDIRGLILFIVHFFAPPKKEPNPPAGEAGKGVTARGNYFVSFTLATTCLFSPACRQAGFQYERTSVVSFIIADVQRFDLISDFSLEQPFKNPCLPAGRLNLKSTISNQ